MPPGEAEDSTDQDSGPEVAYIGIHCDDSTFYDDSDRLWNLSQIFFYVSLACGGLTTLLGWTLGTCFPPTVWRWRGLSIMAAITAVVQVPMFLIFESDSCNYDISRQTCTLAAGAYLNIVSVALWVFMTIWTQCLKPPQWHEELDVWRINTCFEREKRGLDAPSSPVVTESGTEEDWGRRYESRDRGTEEDLGPDMIWTSMRSLRRARDDYRGRQKEMDDVQYTSTEENKLQLKSESAADMTGGRMELARHRSSKVSKNVTSGESERDLAACHACAAFETNGIPGESMVIQNVSIEDCIVEDAALLMESVRDQAPGCNMPDVPRIVSSEEAVACTPPRSRSADRKGGNGPCLTVNCIYPDGTKHQASFSALPSCLAGDEVTGSLEAIRGIGGGDNYAAEGTTDVEFLVRRMRSEETDAIRRRSMELQPPFTTIAIDRGDEGDRTDEVSEMTRGSGLMSGVSEVLDSSNRMDDPLTILEDLARTY